MVVEAEEEEGEVMGEDEVGTEEAVEDTTRGDMGMVVEVGGRESFPVNRVGIVFVYNAITRLYHVRRNILFVQGAKIGVVPWAISLSWFRSLCRRLFRTKYGSGWLFRHYLRLVGCGCVVVARGTKT